MQSPRRPPHSFFFGALDALAIAAAWEDEVLYFVLVDRFSNGREKNFKGNDGTVVAGPPDGTLPFDRGGDNGNAIRNDEDAKNWREAGTKFVGGNLKGLTSKLGYLKRLGVTAVWVSPVLKQVPSQQSYHGYGIQNFLDVDSNFGTRDDFKNMVKAAHDLGIRVILDVILKPLRRPKWIRRFGPEPEVPSDVAYLAGIILLFDWRATILSSRLAHDAWPARAVTVKDGRRPSRSGAQRPLRSRARWHSDAYWDGQDGRWTPIWFWLWGWG